MRLLYNLAAILAVVLIIPVFLVRAVRERGFVERVRQSLGFFPEHALDEATLAHGANEEHGYDEDDGEDRREIVE